MEENTQLPKEVFTRGDYVQPVGEKAIILVTGWTNTETNFRGVVVDTPRDAQFPLRLGEYSETWHTKKFKKVDYAAKLHQVEQENEQLRGWKMEAAELLTKIHSYAHKHLEIKLGQCTVEFVIGRAKERDELKEENAKLKEQATGWRPLLEEVLSKHESGLLPDRFIYEKIKTFLYGE